MFIFILWITVSILIGVWSNNKSNSFATGFFISLLLSPIVGIIYVVASKPKYKCEYCGHEASQRFDFCPICGKNKMGKTLDQLKEEYQQRST